MEKSVKKQPAIKFKLYEVANAAELKVAVKQFVMVNLTRLVATKAPLEQTAQNVTVLVNTIVNEGIDELLHSLRVIQAQNEKCNQTTH